MTSNDIIDFEKLDAGLERIASLPENWNDEGGKPISRKAIASVRSMMTGLNIVPTVDGGLQIDILGGGIEAGIEVDPEGACLGWFLQSSQVGSKSDAKRRGELHRD